MALTSRGRALRWLTKHRGITENPPGSNRDDRKDGITAAQVKVAGGARYLVGQAWCGTWACAAALAAGVKIKNPERWASVAFIEADAKAGVNGFRGWTTNPSKAMRADLVILFGYGVHVETLRGTFLNRYSKRLGWILTDGGNTGSDNSGDQANGGGAFRRWRRLSDVRGFALVDYSTAP